MRIRFKKFPMLIFTFTNFIFISLLICVSQQIDMDSWQAGIVCGGMAIIVTLGIIYFIEDCIYLEPIEKKP